MGIESKRDSTIGALSDFLQGATHSVRYRGTTLQGSRKYLSEFRQPTEAECLDRAYNRGIGGVRAVCQLCRRAGESGDTVVIDKAENAQRRAAERRAALAQPLSKEVSVIGFWWTHSLAGTTGGHKRL